MTPAPSPPASWLHAHWRETTTELFERDGLSQVFTHARNVLTGAVIIAAGLYAVRHTGSAPAMGMWSVHLAGHGVALLGLVLLLLNLCDGLNRLSKRRHHVALRVATFCIYLAVSLRLAQVAIFFRTAM
jgi:hypothetical protein